jgi:hypothetical protein
MKPFDLEKAKSGHPLITRDGRKVRFLGTVNNKIYPLVIAYEDSVGEEHVYPIALNGSFNGHSRDDRDLFLAPNKKTGWVNIYENHNGEPYTGTKVYKNKDTAIHQKSESNKLIDAVQIEWEE